MVLEGRDGPGGSMPAARSCTINALIGSTDLITNENAGIAAASGTEDL